jgi:outer membrane receptor protein involved in Fe transport
MKRILLLATLLIAVQTAFARQGTIAMSRSIVIKGTVLDSKEKSPLPYANVILKNRKDSSFVKGTATGTSGEFLLTNVSEGEYYLLVTYVGYARKTVPAISVQKTSGEINLGTIAVEQSSVAMAGVQVTAERPAEEFKPDKKVINVAKNLQAVGGTAVDVLQNQSSVQIDADGNLTLRGSSNYTVLINGRPSPLQGTDALRQIRASSIENIEIITNPSAKYDAEGAAGIINIVTKIESEYSMSGLVNTGIGTRSKYNGDASFNATYERFTVNGGVDYRNTKNYFPGSIDRSSDVAQGTLDRFTDMTRVGQRENFNVRLGGEVRASDKLTAGLSGSYGSFDFLGEWHMKVRTIEPATSSFAYVKNIFDASAKILNLQTFTTYKFKPSVEELMFEASYSQVKLPNVQTTEDYASDASFTLRGANPSIQKFDNGADRDEGRIKLTYSNKLHPKSTFEAGLQSNLSLRSFDIVFSKFSWTSSAWSVDPEFTNAFDLKSNVYAAFATYSNSVFDFDFQMGLRAEQMDRLLDLASLAQRYELKRLDLFPSFSMTRKLGDHTFQFSYSRRVNRPNEAFLNPIPVYSDSYIRQYGNPNLKPEYINSYELNYQKLFGAVFVNVQTYLRASSGLIVQTTAVDNAGRLLATLENLASSSTMGAELSGSLPLSAVFKLDPALNLYAYKQDGMVQGEQLKTSTTSWTARINTTATVSSSTRIQLTANYTGRQVQGQFEIDPRFMLGVSLRQEFLSKAISLTLNAQNLVNTADFKVRGNSAGTRFSQFVHPEHQVVNLTLTYNFNNFKRTAQMERMDIGNEFQR